jgi:hypothetical protein
MRAVIVALAAGLAALPGCGAFPAGTAEPAAPAVTRAPTPEDPSAAPEGPGDEDAGPCTADAECLLGTPRGCCAAWCPEDSQAWSRVAWAAYQAECAVQECGELEEPACRPPPPPPVAARCIASRCVLVPVTAAR